MDVETARRVLRRVSHAQRFPVGRLVPPVGLLRSTVRGLEELDLALRPEVQSLAGVNLERLVEWIENDVADPVAADQIRAAIKAAPSYVEACFAVYERVHERVESARQLLAEAGLSSSRDDANEAGEARG